MGLDTEDIKKRLSRLELDVKQMNQMIDENLDINATTVGSATEDDHALDDELDVSNASDTSMHAEDSNVVVDNDNPKLENNEDKGKNMIEDEDKSLLAINADESNKSIMEENTSKQSYLQEEILQAIDNPQNSFIENAQNGSIDINETKNLVVDNNAPINDEDTLKEIISKRNNDRVKVVAPEIEQESIEQSKIQTFDSISDTISTTITSDNDTHETVQENTNIKPLIQNESSITDPSNTDQETVQNNGEGNNGCDPNYNNSEISNNTETQEGPTTPNSKYEEKKSDVNENARQNTVDNNNNMPLLQNVQHSITIDKQNSLRKAERRQTDDTRRTIGSQLTDIKQVKDTSKILTAGRNEQAVENEDFVDAKPSTIIMRGENEDGGDGLKKDINKNNESVNEVETISNDENISEGQPSTIRYDLSLNEEKIILPKHTAGKNISTTTSDNNSTDLSTSTMLRNENLENKSCSPTIIIEKRKTTSPFRVISVSSLTQTSSSKATSASSNNVSSSNAKGVPFQRDNSYNANIGDNSLGHKLGGNIIKLQNHHEYLMEKCVKLEKEIKYLRQMESQGSLTLEDGKKLNRAIDKLQEYLDRKTKERYEVGVLLSRQLRRQINRGENGEFWIGRK